MSGGWLSAAGAEEHPVGDLPALLQRDDGFVWHELSIGLYTNDRPSFISSTVVLTGREVLEEVRDEHTVEVVRRKLHRLDVAEAEVDLAADVAVLDVVDRPPLGRGDGGYELT